MDEPETTPIICIDSLWHSPPQQHERGSQNSSPPHGSQTPDPRTRQSHSHIPKERRQQQVGFRDHWKDNRVSIKAKRRLLQSVSFQFPCAANFKK